MPGRRELYVPLAGRDGMSASELMSAPASRYAQHMAATMRLSDCRANMLSKLNGSRYG
jgi:hypothetical protein